MSKGRIGVSTSTIIYTKKRKKQIPKGRSCSKCENYNSRNSTCKGFNISVSSLANAKVCRKYTEIKEKNNTYDKKKKKNEKKLK